MLNVLDKLKNSNKSIFLIVPAIVVPWLTYFVEILDEKFKYKIIISQ